MAGGSKRILFKHSTWDVIPVVCGILHCAYLVGFFLVFDQLPWWGVVAMGLAYSISISWNINGISHNFIHNPYFVSRFLNRCFSVMESVTMGFSQTFYRAVHNQHHVGNSDRPDDHGHTIDWLSIYKHGHDGKPENVWKYTFLSFFRDDPKEIYKHIARRRPWEARLGILEIVCFVAAFTTMGILNWHFIVCLLPFWYFGHCLSYLNGYFEHYAGDPDTPIAWGVSTYHKLYNLIWFNNGYHAEHHYRPKTHWMRMHALHMSIERQQQEAGTRVIRPPHALGFMDPDLPSMDELPVVKPASASSVVVTAGAASEGAHAS